MSKVYVNRKIVKKGTDKVILRTYNSCYGTFNYYLFSGEGDIILQVTDCNCRQIPKVILDRYETYSLEAEHEKKRARFMEWLEHEGYKE
jgi:hypothetical protein